MNIFSRIRCKFIKLCAYTQEEFPQIFIYPHIIWCRSNSCQPSAPAGYSHRSKKRSYNWQTPPSSRSDSFVWMAFIANHQIFKHLYFVELTFFYALKGQKRHSIFQMNPKKVHPCRWGMDLFVLSFKAEGRYAPAALNDTDAIRASDLLPREPCQPRCQYI